MDGSLKDLEDLEAPSLWQRPCPSSGVIVWSHRFPVFGSRAVNQTLILLSSHPKGIFAPSTSSHRMSLTQYSSHLLALD